MAIEFARVEVWLSRRRIKLSVVSFHHRAAPSANERFKSKTNKAPSQRSKPNSQPNRR